MNPPDTGHATDPRRYSPFWALCLVFLPLIFLQGSYVLDDLKQRDQIQATRVQLTVPQAQAQARAVNQTTYAIGQDLLALSTNSPEAAKIIAEFGIQFSNPSQPPKQIP